MLGQDDSVLQFPNSNESVGALLLVIGNHGNLRSGLLSLWLARHKRELRQHFIAPYFPTLEEIRSYNLRSKRHYGGPLTGGEVGCALAHYQGQKFAKSLNSPTAFIFEDDADPNLSISELLLLSTWLAGQTKPCAISLFDGHFNPDEADDTRLGAEVRVQDMRLRKLKPGSFPWGTVAYGLNRPALEIVAQSVSKSHGLPIGKADYPVWGSSVDWYVAFGGLIGHGPGPSMVGQRVDSHLGLTAIGQLRLLFSRLLSLVQNDSGLPLGRRVVWEFWDFYYRALTILSLKRGR